jgi:hypothetical protein
MHPTLAGALLVIVNRRQRRPPHVGARLPAGDPPLFLVRVPSGRLLAGMCARHAERLLIHPHRTSRFPVLEYAAADVEVIGRIHAILRTIGGDVPRAFCVIDRRAEPADSGRRSR